MLSVIVNCYNGEKYLKEALDSVFQQTYQDFEVIFIDNCSTDKSAEIAKSYDKRLKYFKTPVNIPLGKARNFALTKCTGEYIAILDCDDLWEQDKLSIQLDIFKSHPDATVTMSNFYNLNMVDNSKTVFFKDKKTDEVEVSLVDFMVDYRYALSSFMFKKEALDKLNFYFDERLSYAEEYDFFGRLISSGKIIYCNKPLCSYRIHAKMFSKQLKKTLPHEYNLVIENLNEYYSDDLASIEPVIDYIKYQRDFTSTKIAIEEGNNKEARRYIKKYKTRNKKSFLFYLLSFLPKCLSRRIFLFLYKKKI